MFAKSYKLKSNNTLKNSEKKQLVQRIQEQFAGATTENVKELVPVKSNSSCMKLILYSGDLVNVYVVDGVPVVIEDEKGMVPTICALWKFPDLVPSLIIHTPVLAKVGGGAPLYLPGIVRGPNGGGWAPFARGDPIAVCTQDNSAAGIVGRATFSSREMVHLVAGVCLDTIHVYGDLLCKDIKFNRIERPKLGLATYPNEDVTELAANLSQLKVQPPAREEWPALGAFPSPAPPLPASPAPSPVAAKVANKPALITDTPEVMQDDKESPIEVELREDLGGEGVDEFGVPSDMEGLLRWSVLALIKGQAAKLPLPLYTNLLYKNYLMPLCPEGRTLDVKKSSYKKMSKFLEAMQEEGLLEVREVDKGVSAVTAVHAAHPAVRGLRGPPAALRPPPPPQKDPPPGGHDYKPPTVKEVFCVTAAVAELLPEHKKGTPLSPGEVRAGVVQYVKARNLDAGAGVRTDAVLAKVLNKPEQSVVKWDEVMAAVQGRMTAGTELSWPDGARELLKTRLQPIAMTVATRSGNKKVTLVTNLEAFGFNLQPLASSWQQRAATSTTTTSLPGHKRPALMLQGDQTYFVAKTLIEQYGLPKKYVEGADKALKKKK